jgi:hypothetical protein
MFVSVCNRAIFSTGRLESLPYSGADFIEFDTGGFPI